MRRDRPGRDGGRRSSRGIIAGPIQSSTAQRRWRADRHGDAGTRLPVRIRRLTVEGRQAGEASWSPDGQRLVFQSEREPGNPFCQIYTLDLSTGDTMRVSPGQGKTTCAFFNAAGDILFASTHHDPKSVDAQKEELEFRATGKERRYSWDYDPEMDIYVTRWPHGATHAR